MQTVIYRGSKKWDTYLFVEQKDDFSKVPKQLLDMLGGLEFVMQVDLAQRSKLAQVSTADVKKMLMEQGYYLQLPPNNYRNV